MDPEVLSRYTDKAVTLGMEYVPQVALALLTLVVGLWIIGRLTKMTRKVSLKRGVDPTLVPFLINLLAWTLKALLFISVASMVGVQTTSFVAILGAAGLAVGLALQGSLANFAGGVLILVFRPFKVGDLVEAQGQLGVVKEIQIFTTTLISPQNRRVIVPNGPLSNGTIVNFSTEGLLRVDLVVGISYGSDIDKAKQVLLEMLKANEHVLGDPAPVVEVVELADSAVNLAVRPFAKPEHYWDVYFSCLANSKKALDKAGISIPFPQRDVHLHTVK